MSANQPIKICMVIGDPVAHSLSPVMHSVAYKALGIDTQYSFEKKQVAEKGLSKFIDEVKANSIHMLAVTIPHKETIIQYLDNVDETAKQIGAVNTVLNVNGKLIGHNTDCFGAIESLKKHLLLAGKKVAVLGSGGSARAIVYGLVKERCNVTVYGRNAERTNELAKTFGCEIAEWEHRNSLSAEIIINTTPVGRENEELPTSEEVIHKGQIVFDINYNADGTPLLLAAKRKGATIINGLEMLLRQGMIQFELYTGLKAPETIMRNALQNRVNHADAI